MFIELIGSLSQPIITSDGADLSLLLCLRADMDWKPVEIGQDTISGRVPD